MKYSASLSRDFYFNVFHKIHLNGAWFGGRELDRFSKYQFGYSTTPASTVSRRPRPLRRAGGGARLLLPELFEQYRLDLFWNGLGRDRSIDAAGSDHRSRSCRQFPGSQEHDAARRFRQEPAAVPVSDRRSYNLQILILKPLR